MKLPIKYIKDIAVYWPVLICPSSTLSAALCHALTNLWADYYLLLSQTEIITSVNDGEAARAQQLYFPAQLGGREPSHPVNNSMAPP